MHTVLTEITAAGESAGRWALYDPLRFAPERNEGSNPFALISFGGGIHKCTGMNFARNEMAVITAHLLREYNLELLTQDSAVVRAMGANRPSATWVAYRRKPLGALTSQATIQEVLAAGCPHIQQRVADEQA